jgi:hypothetical protein
VSPTVHLLVLTVTLLFLFWSVMKWSHFKGWITIVLFGIFLSLGIYTRVIPTSEINSGAISVLSVLAALAAVMQFKRD